jgi:DNA-binding transcriptional MerR regulator
MTTIEQEFTIGDVAERTGLSAHALRFYEREGLLTGRVRRQSGQRRYSASDLEWINICVKLRASGMPLAAIRRFAELVIEGPGNEHERLALLREQQKRILTQIVELNDCLDVINWKVGIYEQHLAQGTAQDLWTAADGSSATPDPATPASPGAGPGDA